MTVHVVHVLELVEVGEDERERRLETLGAGGLCVERIGGRAAVRQAGETVEERLPLDQPVQAGVLERNHGVRHQRRGAHPLLLVEGIAHELECPEALARGDERKDQPIAVTVGIAVDNDRAVRRHDATTARRGRLGSRGGDDAE